MTKNNVSEKKTHTHKNEFLIIHNCRSITAHIYLNFHTDVRHARDVHAHIFSATKMINGKADNNVKFRKQNHACLIIFLSAVLIG